MLAEMAERGSDRMTVIGTPEEINTVLDAIGYPRQNLGSILSGQCVYIVDGVRIDIILTAEAGECKH